MSTLFKGDICSSENFVNNHFLFPSVSGNRFCWDFFEKAFLSESSVKWLFFGTVQDFRNQRFSFGKVVIFRKLWDSEENCFRNFRIRRIRFGGLNIPLQFVFCKNRLKFLRSYMTLVYNPEFFLINIFIKIE